MYRFGLMLVGLLVPIAAHADGWQIGPPVPPTTAESQIGNYCVYANLIYSLGGGVCVGKTGLVCIPSTKDKDVAGRGYWSEERSSVGGVAYTAPKCF